MTKLPVELQRIFLDSKFDLTSWQPVPEPQRTTTALHGELVLSLTEIKTEIDP